jgi:anti-sigma-K factor RskA
VTNEHERWADAAGAYLLEAMEPDERAAYEAHLATCPDCRAEVDALAPAAEAIPVGSAPVSPPPELKARIMATVDREAQLLRAAGPEADRPPARRRRRAFLLPSLAAVTAVLIAGVLVVLALDRGGETWEGTVDRAQAPQAHGEMHMNEGGGELVLRGLPAPPEGRVYQVWLMPEGGHTPQATDALFTPRSDGSAVAAVPETDGMDAVLVTDEPDGGSTRPSGAPVLTFEPS